MKHYRIQKHNRHLGTISYLLSIFVIFGSMGICLLVSQRSKNVPQIFAPSRTPRPTATSIPLPATIEDVKSECSNGECVNSCIEHVNDVIQQQGFVLPAYSSEEDTDLVYYAISKTDQLDKPRKLAISADVISLQENIGAHQIIWNYFTELLPRETRPNLVMFGIYASSTSDGKFDTTLTEEWIMKVNILALEDASYLSNALIHEYGHYLTLNDTQMHGRTDEWGNCLEESFYGCQPEDAYLNRFYWKFWDDIYSEFAKIEWDSVEYENKIQRFYEKYQDRFINDYAATDPLEDIAESWTAFVLEPLPTGNTVTDQKLRFFYEFPELVQLRYQIIQGICTFEGIPQDH